MIEELRAVSETGCDHDLPFRAADLIEQLQKRIAELEERRCEICGYAEHHREHTGCLRKQRDELNRLCEFNERTMEQLMKQRDELLAAINLIEVDKDGDGFICAEAMEQVRAAITSCVSQSAALDTQTGVKGETK